MTKQQEHAWQAQEILRNQRDRVTSVMKALVQAVDWIAEDKLRPEDREAKEYAKRFIELQAISRKPI